MITDYDAPLAVMAQPLPRAGGNVFRGRRSDYLVDVLGRDMVNLDLSAAEIGTYVWMAQRQDRYQPVTTRLLAEWLQEQRYKRWGERVETLGEAAQIVDQLIAVEAVRTELGQGARLAAVRAEYAEIEALFAEPEAPKRTKEAVPTARQAPDPVSPVNEPDTDGHWRGSWPLPRGAHYPPRGQNVVYLLRAENDLVVYVGSTGDFHARMKAHRGTGKRWATWTAIPCESREEAYDVESEYMAMHMPHLNVAGPRGGEQL